MTELWMEVLPPPYFAGQAGGWFLPDRRAGPGPGAWTVEENKMFERALARVDWDAPDRWERVAEMLPRMTVADVAAHYEDLENDVGFIEAGLVPFPRYGGGGASQSAGFTFKWDGGGGDAGGLGFKRSCYVVGGKRERERGPDQERKKGIPWTEEEHTTEDIYIGRDVLERIVDGSEKPSNLKFLLLQLITKIFSDELKLGHGGCGVVYKGILRNRIIAVKRLSNSHTIEDRMFHQEVQSLMRVKHQNIVQFLGYCSHTEEQALELSGNLVMAQLRERLLCFEYINNGSLRDILTDELRGLDWRTRYQIIKGICEGLHHLHKENHIIHMDLKPSNILLDDQMVPKIIDFGLSRLDDKSRTMTVERLITLGYCAPEYQDHGKMSPKSDIYSLGIIVKELVTGSKEKPSIPKVLRRWKHRWNKSANKTPPLLWYKQVSKCLELATRCTDTNPTNRPQIWDIICELNKVDRSDVNDAAEWLELEDMIGVEPLEIHLPFQFNKKISCSIELSNETNGYDFAFVISTTSLRPYCMEPDRGIVPLGSKCSITITLQELERAPPHDYCRDEFSVQSTRVYGNHASSMDITQDVFNEEPGKVVDNVDLIVVLDVPPSSTSDQ